MLAADIMRYRARDASVSDRHHCRARPRLRPSGRRHDASARSALLPQHRPGVAQLRALALAMRVRPGAVLTTGPAIGVPVALATRLLGGEVVFVETISRVTAPSGTGRIMRRVADLHVVQWPQLAAAEPGSVYAGRLL